MKKSVAVIVGLLVVAVVIFGGYKFLAGTNNSSSGKATGMTVDLNLGTLTTDQTEIWKHVVKSDDIKQTDGNSYNVTVKQYSSPQDLETAIKNEDVFAGVGLSQQDIDSANQNPNLVKTESKVAQYKVVQLASKESEFTGFAAYGGLKQGGVIIAAKFKDGGEDKQKEFLDKIIKAYNNQTNQDWIKKNFPNYQ
ncbi:hypothetical protein PUF88_03990 [Lactobacillaceae bacterium L1_55_11]|nr:hypothetical protein [Lactobacillaceae bacterium L1_55_11]